MNYLEYKGYYGTVEYSDEYDILYGKLIGLKNSTILYEGRSLKELKKDFKDSVDQYIDLFEGAENEPEKPNLEKIKEEKR